MVQEIGGSKDKVRFRMIHQYNSRMNAVDRANQMTSSISVYLKSRKWWKVPWAWALDTTLLNSKIVKNAYQKTTRLDFALVCSLVLLNFPLAYHFA
jgi:hypothetical protein